MVFGLRHGSLGIPAGDDEHVFGVVPVASDDVALECFSGADRHRQHHAGFGNGVHLDLLAESNVAVFDGLEGVRLFLADAQGRNSQADFDGLWHVFVSRTVRLTRSARIPMVR